MPGLPLWRARVSGAEHTTAKGTTMASSRCWTMWTVQPLAVVAADARLGGHHHRRHRHPERHQAAPRPAVPAPVQVGHPTEVGDRRHHGDQQRGRVELPAGHHVAEPDLAHLPTVGPPAAVGTPATSGPTGDPPGIGALRTGDEAAPRTPRRGRGRRPELVEPWQWPTPE